MRGNLDNNSSIFLQIGKMLEDDILRDILREDEQVPSTNELAKLYSINPATAAKGINLLVDDNILYKKRGIGMFVASGAKDIIITKRKTSFISEYIKTLVQEAKSLGISENELITMIQTETTKENV
ncbi:MAG: GntR family transcriptional regulator [Oscillospiraceae bacterium]